MGRQGPTLPPIGDHGHHDSTDGTDIPLELWCLLQTELTELFHAWRHNRPGIGEELGSAAGAGAWPESTHGSPKVSITSTEPSSVVGMKAGDVIRMLTPGGGAWGPPPKDG